MPMLTPESIACLLGVLRLFRLLRLRVKKFAFTFSLELEVGDG
jgi:hypothetical protein